MQRRQPASCSLRKFAKSIIAALRVALLLFFFRRSTELSWFSAIIAALLPLSIIVVVLQVLNLEKEVFSLMGGLSDKTPNDADWQHLLPSGSFHFSCSFPSFFVT
jgi:hypothetical protein